MSNRLALPRLATALLLAPTFLSVLRAQTSPRTDDQMRASYQAHKSDFDYLLGDWEFTAQSKQWGKHHGFWSAVRLDGGQILDEYRVVGDNGQTYNVTVSLRAYNAPRDQWEIISFGQSAGLHDFGTAHREGGDMIIEQKFGVMTPNPSLMHIRYHDIQADHFLWNGDRSTDDGKTWEKDFLQIDARRIGPARSMGPLAPARKPAIAQPSR